MKAVSATAGIAVGAGVMLVASRLEFVPGWRAVQLAAIWIGCAVAAVCAAGLRRGGSFARRAGTAAVVLLVGGALAAVLASGRQGFLVAEDLAQTIAAPDHGRTVFVYESSKVPDGVFASRVAVREGWLPFERTVLEVPAPLDGVRRDGDLLVFAFHLRGEARYDLRTGAVQPSGGR